VSSKFPKKIQNIFRFLQDCKKEHLLRKQFFWWETSMLSIDHYLSDCLELKQLLQEIMEIICLEHDKIEAYQRKSAHSTIMKSARTVMEEPAVWKRGSLTAFEKENYRNHLEAKGKIIGTILNYAGKLSEFRF